ncbi:hypothetical protein Tco_1214562 [Tanacetum coccineum]
MWGNPQQWIRWSGIDNKRTGTGNAFFTTVNLVGRENTEGLVCDIGLDTIVWAWELLNVFNKHAIWLSNYKAEIIFYEKVVRIPLSDGKVLRVLGERPEEKARFLMGAKAGDKKQEEIVVARDFFEVFPDDLSGLPHIQYIEF